MCFYESSTVNRSVYRVTQKRSAAERSLGVGKLVGVSCWGSVVFVTRYSSFGLGIFGRFWIGVVRTAIKNDVF